MNNQKEFFLSSEQWTQLLSVDLLPKFDANPANNRFFLNSQVYNTLFKNDNNARIQSQEYFLKNNTKIDALVKFMDGVKYKHPQNQEHVLKINNTLKKLIEEISPVLSKINFYDVPNSILTLCGVGHDSKNWLIDDTKIFTNFKKQGLDTENFFNHYLNSEKTIPHIAHDTFTKFWFEWHNHHKLKPDYNNSLLLIKDYSNHNPSKDFTATAIREKFDFLSFVDKTQEVFDYVLSLKDKTSQANSINDIQKTLKKYNPQWYEKIAFHFEDKKNNFIEITNFHVVVFNLFKENLTLARILNVTESAEFTDNLKMSLKTLITKKLPNVTSGDVFKNNIPINNQIQFFCTNEQDLDKINVLLHSVQNSLVTLIKISKNSTSSEEKFLIISDSLEKMWFKDNLNSLLPEKTISKGHKI